MQVKLRTVLIFSAVILILNSCGLADYFPVPGSIHNHSTFSDGDRTPEMLMEEAARNGALFLVATDHYKQIEQQKSTRPDVVKDYGFDNYCKRFSSVPMIDGVPVPLIVFTGAEITLASHTLAIGDLCFKDEKLLNPKDQQEAINRINGLGLLSIAAHPNNKNYLYDKSHAEGICGIEIMNDGSIEGYRKTRDWGLKLTKEGKNVFWIGGCDSHTGLDKEDKDRRSRITWVLADKLDKKSILEGMRNGRTYVTCGGATIRTFENAGIYIPGFTYQDVTTPIFGFILSFEKPIDSPISIYVYRDGPCVYSEEYGKEAIKSSPDNKEIFFSWEDKDVQPGKHWYMFEATGAEKSYFITSSIRLRIIEPATSASGKILFCMEDKQGQQALWIINPDGSDLKKWMDWNKKWGKPSFSPDGKKMIFDVSPYPFSVSIMEIASGKIYKAPFDNNQRFCNACWSKQDKVVFAYHYIYNSNENECLGSVIRTVDSDGRNVKELFSHETASAIAKSDIEFPSWSPDGKQIAFVGVSDVFVIDADGKNIKRLTRDTPEINGKGSILWSPTNEAIGYIQYYDYAFAENTGPQFEIISPNGANRRVILDHLHSLCGFDWSPSGKDIAIVISAQDLDKADVCKLERVSLSNPKQRKTIFEKERCIIHWVMWNSYVESK
ncbi:MAG: DPP IV N-terminal domain-containing protein [Candidatus Berkelbacteria bacterium]|nr:DPP IV N-terminal domain-containing protein [Candidatus Berkelbacteria bacterium]